MNAAFYIYIFIYGQCSIRLDQPYESAAVCEESGKAEVDRVHELHPRLTLYSLCFKGKGQ